MFIFTDDRDDTLNFVGVNKILDDPLSESDKELMPQKSMQPGLVDNCT
jgi:hypothetical protein